MRRATRVLCACLSVALAAPPGNARGQAQPGFETTRVAEGVYQFRWQSHNALFITTPAGVVAVDPIGVEAARQLAREIQRTAPGARLVALVYSHSDADHATGAPALFAEMGQQDVPIIAHENAVAPIGARGSADQPPPTMTFSERFAFAPGGRRIELHYLGRSHTDNMIVPFVPDVGVAFAVDFVSNDRVGFQALPGWHFPDFFDALSGVFGVPFQTMVFGHGSPGDRATVQRQIAYYDDLTAAVRRARAEGLSEDEAAERVRLPAYSAWEQYEAWLPLNVRGVYRWLAAGG
jgi:glyoxylase-like metal-dependent hydrolase (beta-lactamase superfamily II)